MGSTGRNGQPPPPTLPPKPALFRSCSTSHLSTTYSYVRGDDPADCLGPPAPTPPVTYLPSKTVSCDNLAGIIADTPRRPNFPYAFLRSKLSVLPEENGGSVLPRGRLFKASSEECFSAVLGPNFGTNTLGHPKRLSESTQAYVSSTESGYDSDSKPLEEGKLDGDSGIVTTEGSDSGSLHGAELTSESGVKLPEPCKVSRLLDAHRLKFLTSQLVEAKPCVVTDDDKDLFWVDDSDENIAQPSYVRVSESFDTNVDASMTRDVFDTEDVPSDLPEVSLIPECVEIYHKPPIAADFVQVNEEDNRVRVKIFVLGLLSRYLSSYNTIIL